VYAGGNFTSIGGAAVRNRLAALDTAKGDATTWNPNVDGSTSVINTIDIAGTTVYVGGAFSSINGNNRNNVAALDADGLPIASFGPPAMNISSQVRSLVVREQVVYIGGEFTITVGGTMVRNRLAALNPNNGALITTWNPSVEGGSSPTVNTLLVDGSTVYVGGRFTTITQLIGGQSVGGQLRNSIAAVGAVSGNPASSGIPTPWNPNISGGNATVRSISIDGARVYFGGEFNRVGIETRNNAAAVDLLSGNPIDWNPSLTGGNAPSVNAIAANGATVFAGGSFTTIGSIPGVVGITHNNFAPLGETPLNPAPTVFSMSPTVGARLQDLEVTFAGENFIDDVSSVNVGSGIAVDSIKIISPTSLKAKITITARASTGIRNFSITNNPPGGGTSTPIPFTINNPAPTVTSLSPAAGNRGETSKEIIVTGSNFISGVTTVSFGPDITVNSITVMKTTQLSANITISASAAIGDRDVSVTNTFPGGGTATLARAFRVNHPIPTLTSIAPASGNRLQTLDVVFTGAGFVDSVTTVNTGAGIKINSITVTNATRLTANLTIAANAATGPRAFSLTNAQPGGASESKTFTITNPAPTLTRLNPPVGGRG
jgi:hypothetical protein